MWATSRAGRVGRFAADHDAPRCQQCGGGTQALNILLDTLIGAIPIVGNVFDFTYKSNELYVALLRYAERPTQRQRQGLGVAALLAFLVVFGLVAWGSVALLR
ncbi:MAG: DUF4112 domain-containing protein [Hymenobacter sp.]